MRVEDARTEEGSAAITRSVRLSWIGGETELWVRVPRGLAPAADDLSAFAPVALLLAMRRAEPLQIDGAMSPRLLAGLSSAQEVVSAWDPTYTRIPVRAARRASAPPLATGRGCCFSRGVDSMYSAAVPRLEDEAVTHLVFCDSLPPGLSEATRRQETEAAREAAERAAKELVVVSTNAREVIDGVLDYDDAFGAILAMLGLSLPRLIGRLTIPSDFDYGSLLPGGSHPLLDPLWSSEAVEIEHDSCAIGRRGKVRWLVEERPDLLPLLHVCWAEDSTGNCGRCTKCLFTMVLLHAADGLENAGSFPPRIDLELIRRARFSNLPARLYVNDVHAALPSGPEDRELREAMEDVLRRCAAAPDEPSRYGITRHQTRLFRAIDAGRPIPPATVGRAPRAEVGELDPSWPPPRDVPAGLLGLAVGVDLPARRHVYALGALPPGTRLGELGAALADRPPDGVELRLDDAGRPVVPRLGDPRPSLAAAIRWALGPVGWRGIGLQARVRSAGRRALEALRRPARSGNASATAWLHERPEPGHLPLYAARHPVLDDVLLTTEPERACSLRYEEPVLLGYLEPCAPVTGSLELAELRLPWAHRWGEEEAAASRRG